MFKRWFRNKTAKIAENELRQVLGFLEGVNDEDMGVVLSNVLGTAKRMEAMASADNLILTALRTGGTGSDLAAIALSKTIRNLQKEGSTMGAGGFMPWMHTLRAYNYPELRGLAREMWGHLRRGLPYLTDDLQPYPADELRPYIEWTIE